MNDLNGKVFFGIDSNAVYPNAKGFFSPSEPYPEYPHEHLADEKNYVYAMIRDGFASLGMDRKHFGTPEWNPLGDIIKPGQSVLIKPNWVIHKNREPQYGDMNCLVTHPSIIRAVLDYVYLALKGRGKITIADAPIQLCNLQELHTKLHYDKIWEFYKTKGIEINVLDLRGLVASLEDNKFFNMIRNSDEGIIVELNEKSCFSEISRDLANRFRITNYDPRILCKHHTDNKHEYMINPAVLDADVIINLPKPKTHRKAGFTACAKNFVGTCMRKEYLPHHTIGSKEENGDEYLKKSILRKYAAKLLDLYNIAAYEKKKNAIILKYSSKILTRIGKLLTNDNYAEGSWYGNDTIWRTIVDLNLIMVNANKEGKIMETPQRQIFHICDMIICGEKEGPIEPSPKKIGAIVMGENAAVVDWLICLIMGFKKEAVRYLDYMLNQQKINDPNKIIIVQNEGKEISLNNFTFLPEWRLIPSLGWQGYIENL